MTIRDEQYRTEHGTVVLYFIREDETRGNKVIKSKGSAPGHHYAPVKNTEAMIKIDDDAVQFLIEQEELIPESEWQKTIKAQKTADAHDAHDRDPDNW